MITPQIQSDSVKSRKLFKYWTIENLIAVAQELVLRAPSTPKQRIDTFDTLNTLYDIEEKFKGVKSNPIRLGEIRDLQRVLAIIETHFPKKDTDTK